MSGPVGGGAVEDGSASTLDALANASDADPGAALQVVGLPDQLPAGVTFDAATQTFTLDASNAAYQRLAAGETVPVTVAYSVSDGFETTPASVSWTVTGSNDVPIVTPDPTAQHPLAEIGGVTGGSGLQSVAGSLVFADADLSDSHQAIANLVSVTWTRGDGTAPVGTFPPATLAALGSGLELAGVDSTGSGAGTVAWTFSVADALFDFLGALERVRITYNIGVAEPGGPPVTQPVTILVTGANDGPLFSAGGQVTGSTEDATTLTVVGQSAFIDADLGDIHAASAAAMPGTLGTLTAGVLNDTTGAGSGGLVGWFYQGNQTDIRALAEGEIKVESFVLTLGDDKGATTTQNVNLTFVGENDAPVVAGTVSGAASEDGVPVQLDALANASDVDHCPRRSRPG